MTQTSAAPVPAKTTDSPIRYADEAAVVERDDVVYRYAQDATGTKLETAVMRIQSSAALQSASVLNFPYASDNQSLEIVYARVRKPDGAVVDTPVSDAQDQPAQVTTIAPMYSDLHLKQLPIRSLTVGDKLEFQLRLTQRQPEIPGEFWGQENFGAGIIFLERSIELHLPKINGSRSIVLTTSPISQRQPGSASTDGPALSFVRHPPRMTSTSSRTPNLPSPGQPLPAGRRSAIGIAE